ncbi:MAG: hypothetical protein KC431_20460, partial [Myxococcales bacterium]|nr:hypothetical protein [Myxococcales bacterium]
MGWPRLLGILADELRIDWLRAQILDELEAMEALLAGEDLEQIRDERERGVAAALDRLPTIRPGETLEEARARQAELDGCELLWRIESALAPDTRLRAGLGQLEDLEESLAVAAGGTPLSVVELIGVAELCRVAALLDELLQRAGAEDHRDPRDGIGLEALRLKILGAGEDEDEQDEDEGRLPRLPGLLAELDRCIERRPPTGDGEPRIAGAASPALDQARKQIRSRRQALQARAERQLRSP